MARRRPGPLGASFRSPIPLLLGGILAALVLILVVAVPSRQQAVPDPASQNTLSEREALSLVARDMRSAQAARDVLTRGQAHFEEGAWQVTVGEAQFHFTMRNRVVVPDNAAATTLQFENSPPTSR